MVKPLVVIHALFVETQENSSLPKKAELNVDRIVHCSVCNRTFSDENYQKHLPCQGSKTLGGSGDISKGSASIQETEGGTKRG